MELALIIIFVLSALAYVAWPLLSKTVAAKGSGAEDELRIQRDIVFAAIKDLEMDREMGRVSEEDFEQLNAGYRQQAIDVLKKIDRAGNGMHRKRLEDELAALRTKRRKGEVIFCSACGSSVGPQDRFCSACGKKLSQPQ